MSSRIDTIESTLQSLPRRHRIAFAAACCERLLPNYDAFAAEEKSGDPTLLHAALEELWDSLNSDRSSVSLRQLLPRLHAAIPDPDDYPDSELVSAALDASSALHDTVSALETGDPKKIAAVANSAYETVHMFIQLRGQLSYDDPRFDEKIHEDPLMMRELSRQDEDLRTLRRADVLNASTLQALRDSSRNEGRSNIGKHGQPSADER